MKPFPYKRVVVIGTTSSGKSTLAKGIADKLGLDFIELDALHWEPNWREAPLEVFRERVRSATSSNVWVVAGNYHVVRDLVWPQAQAVIWLDYPFPVVFWRLLKRTVYRSVTKEKLFAGNVESFSMHLKLWSEDSLFHWLFKTYWRRKRETPLLLARPEHLHLALIHFSHPREAEAWMNELSANPGGDLEQSQQEHAQNVYPPLQSELSAHEHEQGRCQQTRQRQETDARQVTALHAPDILPRRQGLYPLPELGQVPGEEGENHAAEHPTAREVEPQTEDGQRQRQKNAGA
ncbi:MAG: hypothetical protein HND47_20240 [Chloroflexi bacterium]|nr:hypothetical protein [Chloroflexota bacterium]